MSLIHWILVAQLPLAARSESLPAFVERCIPAGLRCSSAEYSRYSSLLGALPSGRIARLGAAADSHHGLPGMGVSEYRAELQRLASLLEVGDVATAQSAARSLQGAVINGAIPFTADGSLLKPVAELAPGQNTALLVARLRAAASNLEGSGVTSPGTTDRKALKAIRESWDLELKKGQADLYLPRVQSPPEWLLDRAADLLNMIQDWLNAIWKALFGRELKPREKGIGAAEGTLALVALASAVFAVLAYRAYRARLRVSAKPLVEESAEPDRDDDPTSRPPSEWELHAEALARAGRYREAIRAWYHAVLAATFSRGFVTYAKGRTNWEYVAALSPGLPFRNDVISMTQRFEGCWYGGREASPRVLSEQKIAAQAALVFLTAERPS